MLRKFGTMGVRELMMAKSIHPAAMTGLTTAHYKL